MTALLLRSFAALLAAALIWPATAQAQRGGPAPVFVESVEARDFSNRIEALGTLNANERVSLTVNVADRVTGVYFEDGQRVEQGQPLLSQVQGEQAAQVDGAAATVVEARQVVDRMAPLVEEGAVAGLQYDQAKRDLEVAKSRLRALQIQQTERVVSAPFDGVLGFRRVSVGAFFSPGDVVATLLDDSVMNLDFDVPSIFLRQLVPGLPVTATSADFPGEVFSGEVVSVDNAIDPVTRAIQVRAEIPNPDRRLFAGSFMTVLLEAESSTSLAIPEEAVQPLGPQTFIFVAEPDGDGHVARRREVELARRQGGYIEVRSGVGEGELVITEGVIRVRQGAPVTIKDRSLLLPDDGVGVSASSVDAAATPG